MTEREAFESWRDQRAWEMSSYVEGVAFETWQACAEAKDKRIAELEAELTLRRKSGSATERLHNLVEGISRDADGSEWSREEWERLDAENAALRKQVAELTAERESAYNAACSKWVKRHDELTAERDRFAKQAGECDGGYQTLEKEVATLRKRVAELNGERVSIRAFIASDEWAITFQTMAQYRTALLRKMDGAMK